MSIFELDLILDFSQTAKVTVGDFYLGGTKMFSRQVCWSRTFTRSPLSSYDIYTVHSSIHPQHFHHHHHHPDIHEKEGGVNPDISSLLTNLVEVARRVSYCIRSIHFPVSCCAWQVWCDLQDLLPSKFSVGLSGIS